MQIGFNIHRGHKSILNSSLYQNINAPRIQISHPDIIPTQVAILWLHLPSEYGSCVFWNNYSANRRACDTMPRNPEKARHEGRYEEAGFEKGTFQLHEKMKYFSY